MIVNKIPDDTKLQKVLLSQVRQQVARDKQRRKENTWIFSVLLIFCSYIAVVVYLALLFENHHDRRNVSKSNTRVSKVPSVKTDK
jgi:hypothetical protein